MRGPCRTDYSVRLKPTWVVAISLGTLAFSMHASAGNVAGEEDSRSKILKLEPTSLTATTIDPIDSARVPVAVPPSETTQSFTDLTQGDGMGLRTQFLSVGAEIPEPESTASIPKASTVVAGGGVPLGLVAGLGFLGLLGGTMWYMVRNRAR
ncbi:MAG TPA: hypothetical protein VK968_11210 [Roseimicrobium sp.]|nr:hypothetical protein [Roseimicrobium sp.]